LRRRPPGRPRPARAARPPRSGLAAAGAVRDPPRGDGGIPAREAAPEGRAGGGGVWESRAGGRTWTPRADDQPTVAIGAVAFAPGDPSVAYAGTGQGGAPAPPGVGLLRAGAGGATWRTLVVRELLGAGFHDLLVD